MALPPAEEARLNEGDIYLDGLVLTLDDENNITSTSYWAAIIALSHQLRNGGGFHRC
ncbi:hypothetical protein [Salmonella enterica]|uniref:hypothetical protein n=1 Tax=Salmonella enterica TaxID=28901 RepID=UPI003F4B02A4